MKLLKFMAGMAFVWACAAGNSVASPYVVSSNLSLNQLYQGNTAGTFDLAGAIGLASGQFTVNSASLQFHWVDNAGDPISYRANGTSNAYFGYGAIGGGSNDFVRRSDVKNYYLGISEGEQVSIATNTGLLGAAANSRRSVVGETSDGPYFSHRAFDFYQVNGCGSGCGYYSYYYTDVYETYVFDTLDDGGPMDVGAILGAGDLAEINLSGLLTFNMNFSLGNAILTGATLVADVSFTTSNQSVPAPGTLALLGLGLLSMRGAKRKSAQGSCA